MAAIDRERILKAARQALSLSPITITQFRAKLSEGGPNDFYSNGDYWWPDPTKPDGLPYIQRDGQTNPENFNQHRLAVRQLRDAVAALGAAYKLTGEDRYAAKAAELLRVFFLDPATRMNPHLNYAQAIPGVSSGRGIGIIDTLHLIEIPPAIEAMRESPAFPKETHAGLKQWFGDYTEWMLTSKNGTGGSGGEEQPLRSPSGCRWRCLRGSRATRRDWRNVGGSSRRSSCPKQMAADGSFPARTQAHEALRLLDLPTR